MFAVQATASLSARVNTAMPKRAGAKKQRFSTVVKAASIVETCRANGCGKFAELAERVGLDATLAAGTFTVFAPNDAAFAAFNPEGLNLPDVLNFHCIKGKIAAKHVTNYPLIMTLEVWIKRFLIR
jgi:uncharacterized surface protein with fasciclin (FAS1) repeats